jgi:hypothetical protein
MGSNTSAADHGEETRGDIGEPWGATQVARGKSVDLAGSNIAIGVDHGRPTRDLLAACRQSD